MKFRSRLHHWLQPMTVLMTVGCLISLWLTLTFHSPLPAAQAQTPEIRGVWLTTNDTDVLLDKHKLADAMEQLAKLNFNTVYPVIWNSGYVKYPSAVAQQAGIQSFVPKGTQGHDPLAEIIDQGHRHDLVVIPWFEFGFMAPLGSEMTTKHPQWLTQDRDGKKTWNGVAGEVALLNPFHPEVQKFITDLLVELVTNYDVDGVQFDDHMSLPHEFGYDRYTTELYRKATKRNPPPNSHDPEWVRWRANQITAFMQKLHNQLKAIKPNIYISVSPNHYDYAYKAQLQDWLTWVKQGMVDELIMQVYRSEYSSFLDHINKPEVQETRKRIPTGIGILTGLRQKPVPIQQVWQQVLASRDRGLGVSFFSYESLWDYAPESAAERQQRFQTLFYSPARRLMNDIFHAPPSRQYQKTVPSKKK